MIQSFRKDFIEKPTYEFDGGAFYLKLDSSNRVYQFFYSAPRELETILDRVGNFILDKNIEDLNDSFTGLFTEFCHTKKISPSSFEFSRVLFLIKALFDKAVGLSYFTDLNSDKIICRCFAVDENHIEDSFEQHKGELKPFVKESYASMGCGSCAKLLKQKWSDLEKQSQFYQGKTKEEINKIVLGLMTEFTEYSGQDLSVVELRSIEIQKDLIQFELALSDPNFDLDRFKNQVTNYLHPKLGFLPRISVTIL